MMKLTLTREQVPLARETVAWIMGRGPRPYPSVTEVPGYDSWKVMRSPSEAYGDPASRDWADALEAAITEAEHPMQVITLAKPGDADERAFWREAFTLDYAQPSSWCGADRARYSVQAADVALAGYRAAFCTGMPSDQKGAK